MANTPLPISQPDTVISLRGGVHATIAHAVPADGATVVAYLERVAGESDFLTFGPGELGRNAEQQAEQIRGFADHSKGLMLNATIEGELAGVVAIFRSPRSRVHHSGELGISVRQKFWGIGLGRALCEAAIVEARHIGLTRIELRTRHDNLRAIALYEDLGFQLEGRLRGSFKVEEVEYDDLLMGLRLHSDAQQ